MEKLIRDCSACFDTICLLMVLQLRNDQDILQQEHCHQHYLCCVFVHGAGSRLDRGLDKGNIRMLPFVADDLEEVRSLLASRTLTFQECIARERKALFNRCLTVVWGLLNLLVVWEISHLVIAEDGGVIRVYDTSER